MVLRPQVQLETHRLQRLNASPDPLAEGLRCRVALRTTLGVITASRCTSNPPSPATGKVAGSVATPVLRPLATSRTARCCEPWDAPKSRPTRTPENSSRGKGVGEPRTEQQKGGNDPGRQECPDDLRGTRRAEPSPETTAGAGMNRCRPTRLTSRLSCPMRRLGHGRARRNDLIGNTNGALEPAPSGLDSTGRSRYGSSGAGHSTCTDQLDRTTCDSSPLTTTRLLALARVGLAVIQARGCFRLSIPSARGARIWARCGDSASLGVASGNTPEDGAVVHRCLQDRPEARPGADENGRTVERPPRERHLLDSLRSGPRVQGVGEPSVFD